MRTLGQLKAQVKRYLTSNTNLVNVVPGQSADREALDANIDFAIVEAANNARRFAEQRHDFQVSLMTGTAVVSSSVDCDLEAVTVGQRTYAFKTLQSVALDNLDGTYSPVRVVSRQLQVAQLHRQQDLDTARYQEGYQAVVQGRKLTLSPLGSESVNIAVTGYVWLDDYENEDSTDWILTRGFEYMQWATICELNHMLLKYVPRQEGTMAPPERNREIALENLIVCDSFALEGGILHDL